MSRLRLVRPATPGPPPWGTWLPRNAWDLLADREVPERSVSVVVTHFEQPEQLARTLAALSRQTLAPHEVVVVDDGSRAAPHVPPGVRLLRQEDRGFRAAAARHLGATHASGDVLVFLDADTTPEPRFVEALTRLPRLAPDLLAVGRRRHADLAGAPVTEPVEVLGPGRELTEPGWLRDAYAGSRDLLDADDLSCRFVISAVMACSRWWYDVVGGFDPGFTAYGGEDWELAHRSWLAGGLVAHAAEAVAWHDGPDAGEVPRGVKARESVAVAGRIGVPGIAPHGLLGVGGRRVPVDRLLALPDDLDERTVLLLADAALHADPGVHLLLGPAHAELLHGDPRVVPREAASPLDAALVTPARVLVELHRPWALEPAAWRALLRGAGLAGAVGTAGAAEVRADGRDGPRRDVVEWSAASGAADGAPGGGSGPAGAADAASGRVSGHAGAVATSTALRLVRRARRWGEEVAAGASGSAELPGAPLAESVSPESWWGGWAPGAPRP